MSFRQIAAFGAVGTLMAAGALGGSRWRRLETQRVLLNQEYERTMSELRAFDEDALRRSTELHAKEGKTKEMQETVDILWTDRLQRYEQTNLDLHAYLRALPEALGATKGLTNHYRYMTEEMRKFVGFDIACSKVHNFALLLQHGKTVGFPRVTETIREMFAAEPLVAAVCENVQQLEGISCPRSLAETSAAFAFCLEELQGAVERANARFVENAAVPVVAAQTPNALIDGVRELVRKSKLDTLSQGQRELVQKRAALDKLLERDRWQLHSEADVRVALDYALQLCDHYTKPPKKPLFGRVDEVIGVLQKDAEVRRAVQQVALWRNSAAAFLMQRQAEDALDCYQLLLAETLTKVNELPN